MSWSLFILLAVYASADAAEKLRIAIPEPNAALLTFPLAYKKGFLTGQGVAVEVISMRGPLMVAALDHGEIDYLTGIPRSV